MLLLGVEARQGRCGDVRIALEMPAPAGRAIPAALTFWINGEKAMEVPIARTAPPLFTALETFDIGMDAASPVAHACFEEAPFACDGDLKRLQFTHFQAMQPSKGEARQLIGKDRGPAKLAAGAGACCASCSLQHVLAHDRPDPVRASSPLGPGVVSHSLTMNAEHRS
jgi:hypothetical protein